MRVYEDVDNEWNDNVSYEDFSEKKMHTRKPKCFPTSLRCRIINAYTGNLYSFMQGSYEELRLYKVIDSRAIYNQEGCRTRRTDPVNKDPVFLYYDSPEQYMRHMKVVCNPECVAEWYEDKSRMFPCGVFVKEVWDLIRKEKSSNS